MKLGTTILALMLLCILSASMVPIIQASPETTHWWQSAEGFFNLTREMFHWIGDGNSDGVVDISDLTKAGKSFGLNEGQTGYDADADTAPEPEYHTNDNRVDMRDIIELSRSWGKQRYYA